MPGLSKVRCKSDVIPAACPFNCSSLRNGFNRAFHDSSVLPYMHMEKITEVSLLLSEKAAAERRVYTRR